MAAWRALLEYWVAMERRPEWISNSRYALALEALGLMQSSPSKSRQALLIVDWLGLSSPAEQQCPNPHRHRFPVGIRRTGRALRAPKRQSAAELSPDPFPHIRIMGDGGRKSSFRSRISLGRVIQVSCSRAVCLAVLSLVPLPTDDVVHT